MGLTFPAGLRSEVDGELALTIAGSHAGVSGDVTGTVTVARSAYREPLAVVTTLLSTLRTDRLARTISREPSAADRVMLNVRVITDEDVRVDNNVARLSLGGDLRIVGTLTEPGLSGRATLKVGGQLFVGPTATPLSREQSISPTRPPSRRISTCRRGPAPAGKRSR